MRRHHLGEEENEGFWPGFTDLMSTIALVLFLVMLIATAQAALAARYTVEGSEKVQQIFTERTDTTRAILTQLGGKPDDLDNSAAITLPGSSVLFPYEGYTLSEEAKRDTLAPIADALEQVLRQYYDKIDTIVIEGHTAGPARTQREEQWELGAQRAVAVMNFLQEHNPQLQDPKLAKKLGVASYSFYRPPKGVENIPIGECKEALKECDTIRRMVIRVVLLDSQLKEEITRVMNEAANGGAKP